MEKSKVKEKRRGFPVRKYSALRTPAFAKPLQQGTPYSAFQRGFTLIEIIIFIVLAGIIIPVIVVPFVTGVRGSGKPEMVTTAMYLAHYKMEEFIKYEYLNSALTSIAMTSYANISGFSGYQWQWEIYYVDSNFNVVGDGIQATNHRGYKRIHVRVIDPMTDTYEIYSVVTFFP